MQQTLFAKTGDGDQASSNNKNGMVEHIKGMIKDRFGVDNVPDAFIYLPESLGGLAVRNPFISLLETRKELERQSPEAIIKGMHEAEHEDYKNMKKKFDETESVDKRIAKFQQISKYRDSTISQLLSTQELENFVEIDEYNRWRNLRSHGLENAYLKLCEVPSSQGPALDTDMWAIFGHIDGQDQDPKGERRYGLCRCMERV